MQRSRPRGRLGSVIAGKWRVDRQIGSGGMATVYEARHVNNGFKVALKILSRDGSRHTEARNRFCREGHYANQVDHEGVVSVIDDGVAEDGCPFLVMELLSGSTLEDKRLAAPKERLPWQESVQYALSILEVLAAAHEAGLVHRDVKPSNVFHTEEGAIKLLDFGVSGKTQLTDDQTKTGAGCGTPMFMAPEQVTGADRIDARADLFALAVCVHRLATAGYPFEAKSLVDYLRICMEKPPPTRLDRVLPDVPAPVADVLVRALSFDPDLRYQDAREMSCALARAMRGEGVETESNLPSCTIAIRTVPRATFEAQAHFRPRMHSAPPPPPVDDFASGPQQGLPSFADMNVRHQVASGSQSLPQPAPKRRGGVIVAMLAFSITAFLAAAVFVAWPAPQPAAPQGPTVAAGP